MTAEPAQIYVPAGDYTLWRLRQWVYLGDAPDGDAAHRVEVVCGTATCTCPRYREEGHCPHAAAARDAWMVAVVHPDVAPSLLYD